MPYEQQLIARILQNDPHATTQFVDEYSRIFTVALRRIIPNRDDLIADIVQDVFVSLLADDHRKLRAWRGKSSLKTYLLKVASNIAKDCLRGRLYRPLGVGNGADPDTDHPHQVNDSPLRNVLLRDIHRAVDQCLRQLGVRDRELLSRRHLRDEPPRLIAEVMGLTPNSVSVGLTRAAERMKECINSQFPGLFRLEPFEPHDTF